MSEETIYSHSESVTRRHHIDTEVGLHLLLPFKRGVGHTVTYYGAEVEEIVGDVVVFGIVAAEAAVARQRNLPRDVEHVEVLSHSLVSCCHISDACRGEPPEAGRIYSRHAGAVDSQPCRCLQKVVVNVVAMSVKAQQLPVVVVAHDAPFVGGEREGTIVVVGSIVSSRSIMFIALCHQSRTHIRL